MDILKRFCVLALFCLVLPLYSLEWLNELSKNFKDKQSLQMPTMEVDFTRFEFLVHTQVFDGERFQKYSYSIADMTLNNLGFLENKIDGVPHFHVLGNRYMLVFTKDPLSGLSTTMTDVRGMDKLRDPAFWENREHNYMDSNSMSPMCRTISSSSLSEYNEGIEFSYTGSRFSEIFMVVFGRGYHNIYALPWVEGVEGPGIGEWVQVEPTSPKTVFYILNGFVDPYRPRLYKMNSRVKDGLAIGITSTGKTIEQSVHFEDFAYFKTVIFPEPVVTMRLVIQSVYPGSKWQDTAISAILLEQEDGVE